MMMRRGPWESNTYSVGDLSALMRPHPRHFISQKQPKKHMKACPEERKKEKIAFDVDGATMMMMMMPGSFRVPQQMLCIRRSINR